MMSKRVLLVSLLILAVGPLCLSASTAPVVELRHADRYRLEGWGTSLCWWANRVGDWPDAQLDSLVKAVVDPEDGLGLSVFRYNIGGGENPEHEHMRPGGEMPGFQASAASPIDPEADPRQRRVLRRLIAATSDPILEAFSNSPPYWMTRSGCASGADDGGVNLRAESVAAFAEYLAEVVRVYREEHGVTFRTLAPFNEPNQGWWTAGHNQEGCHFSEAMMAAVVAELHAALRERSLDGETSISATDAHDIDAALRNARSLDNATLDLIAQVNTHSYRGSRRAELREFCADAEKRLWQSESGPMGLPRDGAAHLRMMERVALDLNELRPTAWLMWQVVGIKDRSDWACLNANNETHTLKPTRMFWLHRQFTRHIRPGDAIVPTSDPATVVAQSADGGGVTVVVTNAEADERRVALPLDGLGVAPHEVIAYRSSGQRDRDASDAVSLSAEALEVRIAAREVVTVVLRGE